MGSHLVLLGHLFHEERVVTTVLLGPLAQPANELPILLTEELEFLSMVCTKNHLQLLPQAQHHLPEPVRYVGQVPIGSQVPRLVAGLAHRTAALFFLANTQLLAIPRDAGLAEAVSTVYAQGFCQELQAD
ncbi:hypothetical protein DBR06_SOUSAS15710075, partial [Sousa chinensis]